MQRLFLFDTAKNIHGINSIDLQTEPHLGTEHHSAPMDVASGVSPRGASIDGSSFGFLVGSPGGDGATIRPTLGQSSLDRAAATNQILSPLSDQVAIREEGGLVT